MPELLFELGCEELPANAVKRAFEQLESEIVGRLAAAGVQIGVSQSLGTPRRLIVCVEDVSERLPFSEKEQRGPSLKSAYDAGGQPTPALLGFCRAQGVQPDDVRRDGEYVWISKRSGGNLTADLLRDILPSAIRALAFEKSMRWGSGRTRFSRPIRWILATFGREVVPFEIEGVASSDSSRGHRFNSPEPFPAPTFSALMHELRSREVEPDPSVREWRIIEGARNVATGEPELTDALIQENVYLTEWPTALEGEFKAEYLELPESVLVTAMAKHERFFPVRGPDGQLTNRFISIRNAGEDDTVRNGNIWVLNARFNDAKFFFDEDQKLTLEQFLAKTTRMTFQETLGTVRQRADRLSFIAENVASLTGANEAETEFARLAGLYCKADLSTGLVGELPALQGVIGGLYAKRDGFDDAVCRAIGSHYDLEKSLHPECAGVRTALRVLIADQLDKLIGYLGMGLIPSGSSDPFGLRRCATLLIEAAWIWPERAMFPSYVPMFDWTLKAYLDQKLQFDFAAVFSVLTDIFSARYEAMLPDVRHDVLDAALLDRRPGAVLDPRAVRFRVGLMARLSADISFTQTATRPLNIVSAARKKNVKFDEDGRDLDQRALDSAEGTRLKRVLEATAGPYDEAVQNRDADAIIASLKSLEEPVNEFFEGAMVMADDERVRAARLTLLAEVCHRLRAAGDFSKLAAG